MLLGNNGLSMWSLVTVGVRDVHGGCQAKHFFPSSCSAVGPLNPLQAIPLFSSQVISLPLRSQQHCDTFNKSMRP